MGLLDSTNADKKYQRELLTRKRKQNAGNRFLGWGWKKLLPKLAPAARARREGPQPKSEQKRSTRTKPEPAESKAKEKARHGEPLKKAKRGVIGYGLKYAKTQIKGKGQGTPRKWPRDKPKQKCAKMHNN